MTKYNILVQQPRPRAQVYVDENTTKRLVFDFGEASFEQRAKFKQMAEKLTHGSTLTITAPERLVTEHFIVVDALKMTIKNHKNERLYD